jgi:hypothetical protein
MNTGSEIELPLSELRSGRDGFQEAFNDVSKLWKCTIVVVCGVSVNIVLFLGHVWCFDSVVHRLMSRGE